MGIIRMKIASIITMGILLVFWAVVAIAAVNQAVMTPSWFEHVDLMQSIIVGLALIVVWFSIRTLRKIDANQTLLFNKHGNHEHRLSQLEGAHAARTGMKLSCSVDEG